MSGNNHPVIEVVPPENTQRAGPFIGPNRMRHNNHQIHLINMRDRLFHTLFYRTSLAYARTIPKPLRRVLEFILLMQAIAAFFVLVYIHITFSRTPSTCLAHVQDTWPRDGILRVEIVRNAGKDYNIEQSYAKEEKLKQGKGEDFVHVIGLLAREGFVYIEPTAVEESTKETQPLDHDLQNYGENNESDVLADDQKAIDDSLLNVSGISPTIWSDYDMLTAHLLTVSQKPSFLDHIIDRTEHDAVNSTKILENDRSKEEILDSAKLTVYPEDEYIVEFSLEFGFLRLSPSTRARLKIPVEIVTLNPEKDACFGDAFTRLVLAEFLGYDDLLLASIKTLAEKEDNKGYLRNVVSGEHYRFVSMWMARTSYFAAFFIMIVFTVSVSMLLRYSHHQIFVFIVDLMQMLEFNVAVSFPAAPLLTVILALVVSSASRTVSDLQRDNQYRRKTNLIHLSSEQQNPIRLNLTSKLQDLYMQQILHSDMWIIQNLKKMIQLLHPGYSPPNRKQIANELLDEVYDEVSNKMKEDLAGKTICMSQDGWSNIHNESVICISITDVSEEKVYLCDTIDTQEKSHTGEYLLELAKESIKSCQKLGCKVRSFVTDNASNMNKMRGQLSVCLELGSLDILTYGCSAHILNLLAHDIEVPGIKDKVKTVMKYFRNTHFLLQNISRQVKKKLILPQDVRWNTLADCLDSYDSNCPKYPQKIDL